MRLTRPLLFAIAWLCLAQLMPAAPAAAQAVDAPVDPTIPAEPPLRRWLDLQTFTLYSRYRFTANSEQVTTSNQLQYKDAVRARVNIDASKRYSISFGYFSGSSFISTWNNWGTGNATEFDGRDNYFKQLYASALPVDGLELQYGGLYLNRGEGDEFLTYDDDGYLMGSRVSFRRPRFLYFDEVTITRAALGPFNTPNLGSRWDSINHPNYTSADRQALEPLGRRIARIQPTARCRRDPIRHDPPFPAERSTGDRSIRTILANASPTSDWVRTLGRARSCSLAAHPGGIRQRRSTYGGWNADRMQSGRRWFAIATVPIVGPLSASFYGTHSRTPTWCRFIRGSTPSSAMTF